MFSVFGSLFVFAIAIGCWAVVLQIYRPIVPLQPNARKFRTVTFVRSFLTWWPTSLDQFYHYWNIVEFYIIGASLQ